jgi:hypothetical protein
VQGLSAAQLLQGTRACPAIDVGCSALPPDCTAYHAEQWCRARCGPCGAERDIGRLVVVLDLAELESAAVSGVPPTSRTRGRVYILGRVTGNCNVAALLTAVTC